jgi:hypothetical protein
MILYPPDLMVACSVLRMLQLTSSTVRMQPKRKACNMVLIATQYY